MHEGEYGFPGRYPSLLKNSFVPFSEPCSQAENPVL
jgi:hypothetical protein